MPTDSKVDFQSLVKDLQAHLTALRDLDENGDRKIIIDHLYKLAATAGGAAETLKQRSGTEQEDESKEVKGVSKDLQETTDRNVEHVERELKKPLEQLTEEDGG